MDKVVEKEVTTTVVVGPQKTARIWRVQDRWSVEKRWIGGLWQFVGNFGTFEEARKAARNEVKRVCGN